MLKRFFDVSTGFRSSKISVECSVHLCSCPCTMRHPVGGIAFFPRVKPAEKLTYVFSKIDIFGIIIK